MKTIASTDALAHVTGACMLFVLIVVFLPVSSRAQFCETVTDSAWMHQFDRLIAESPPAMRAYADTGIIRIPVVFHVETRSGVPVISDTRIMDALDRTNEWFFSGGLHFFRCGEIMTYPEGYPPAYNHRAVNVRLYRASTGCGAAMGSFVTINVQCNRTLENILSHELGHVVGLPHTHGYTNSGTTNELVDGSNCATHGDRFCDTPADPNLLGKVNAACRYTGTARDANAMLYQPNTRNIMSYTSSKCADTLTPMQLTRARAVALASRFECCGVQPPVTKDTIVCYGETATLVATGQGNEIVWYESPEGGSPVGSGPLFQTPPMKESRAWYVEVVDSCISKRARAIVHVALAAGVMTDIASVIAKPDTSSRPSLFKLTSDATRLLFSTSEGALWISDGTTEGTRRLAGDFAGPEMGVTDAVIWKNTVLYGVNDRGTGPSLFRVDPGGATPETLLRIMDRDGFSNFHLVALDSLILFILNDGNDMAELWRSDGSAQGTSMIHSFSHTSAYHDFGLTVSGSAVYFSAADSLHGAELWYSDGSESGTRMVADIAAGPEGSRPGDLALSDGLLYFSADDGQAGRELWVTDGTSEGTRLVADIRPGPESSNPGSITALLGHVFMYADDGTHGYEPWVSDGSPDGTRLVADIRPGPGSFPQHFTSLNGRVFCVANDGSGAELWELLNGGLSGAAMVKDIHPFSGSGISSILVSGRELLFTANDGVHGNELWRSDGSETGTRLVADIDTAASSSPHGLTLLGDRLVFFANNREDGPALYTITSLEGVACRGESAVLTVGNYDGIVRWYDREQGGTLLHQGRHWRTPAVAEATTYWAEVASGACVSARRAIPIRLLAPLPSITGPGIVIRGDDAVLHAHAGHGVIEWHSRDDGSALIDTGSTLTLRTMQLPLTIHARTVEGDCKSDFISHHIRITSGGSIEALPHEQVLHIYPQPARRHLYITRETVGPAEVRVIDLLGRIRIREMMDTGGLHALNVSRLQPGVYVMEIQSKQLRVSQLFLVAD
jgi:ELWxxDGT repeat protein